MGGTNVRKGQNVPLVDDTGQALHRLDVVLNWMDPTASLDVDVSALLLGSDGKVRSDADLVFYNAPVSVDEAVRLAGKTTSEDGCEALIAIDVDILDASINSIVLVGSLDSQQGVPFGDLAGLALTVKNERGIGVLEFPIPDATVESAFAFGEIYHRNEEWRFRAIGQGWESGLGGLAADYGISVADAAPDPQDASETADEPPIAVAAPSETPAHTEAPASVAGGPEVDDSALDHIELDLPADESVLAHPVLDSEAQPMSPDEAATTSHVVEALPSSAPVASRRGIVTQKRPSKPRPLPPLTMVGGPNWSAARLFSIYAVGAMDEQEKRATSALLATAMSVKEFGRAIVSRIGGPAGGLETYQEVSFKLGDRTVSPDGVIRVGRGSRVWTALLETKTGANQLRPEQVQNYLDLASAKGYDAVITLSNEISLSAAEHPTGIDQRKLKKVALRHISWSEILHEAQMILLHRGVEDRVQAWILNELIRYLVHPRSGAAGFDDMGAHWVPVRESISSGTLRGSNPKIIDVVRSWDKLMRHLTMRMSSQLGVAVAVVVPRTLASNEQARLGESVSLLVNTGTLQSRVRIQQAVGALEVTTDLRSNRIRVALEVDAPQEGGSSRRINWLIRQLRDAPDSLSIEVIYARKGVASCEMLRDVRDSPSSLIPESSTEVKLFRLMESFPMGPKRNGLKSAFIPSVNAAVDTFYAQVVQSLKPWTKPAAKLPATVAEEAADTIDALEDNLDELNSPDGDAGLSGSGNEMAAGT